MSKKKKHPYDDPIEIYKGFPIHRCKHGISRYCKYETRHQLHVSGPTIKMVIHQIDHLLKVNNRRFNET